LSQWVVAGELVGRNTRARKAMRSVRGAFQKKGYASPALVMPANNFVPPSAIVPTQHDPIRSVLVQPYIERAKSRLRDQHWSQLNTDICLRDCKSHKAQVQHRESPQLSTGYGRAQS
jgi:hypothetical protein